MLEAACAHILSASSPRMTAEVLAHSCSDTLPRLAAAYAKVLDMLLQVKCLPSPMPTADGQLPHQEKEVSEVSLHAAGLHWTGLLRT